MSAASKKRRYVRNPKFMTAGEAAALAEMSENAIRWNLRKGYLKGIFDGYRWRIDRHDLERWREEYYFGDDVEVE
jgi:excisionase family DNA binding protein